MNRYKSTEAQDEGSLFDGLRKRLTQHRVGEEQPGKGLLPVEWAERVEEVLSDWQISPEQITVPASALTRPGEENQK